jgi:hypothetical protein
VPPEHFKFRVVRLAMVSLHTKQGNRCRAGGIPQVQSTADINFWTVIGGVPFSEKWNPREDFHCFISFKSLSASSLPQMHISGLSGPKYPSDFGHP